MDETLTIIDHIGLLRTTQDFKNKHVFDKMSKLTRELREKYGPIGKLVKHESICSNTSSSNSTSNSLG